MSNTTEKNTTKTAAVQAGAQTTGKARYLTAVSYTHLDVYKRQS